MQKLGHCALDDVVADAQHIERMQKDCPSPNMDNLVSVLQDELRAVQKELKESAVAMAGKAVRIAQPALAPAKPTNTAAGRYTAPSSGMLAPQRRLMCFLFDQEGHFVGSCPIRAETFHFMKQAGHANAFPQRQSLPPKPSVEGAADEDGSMYLN